MGSTSMQTSESDGPESHAQVTASSAEICSANGTFWFDDFQLDCGAWELRRNGALVRIDAVVLRVLAAFLRNPDRIISKADLFEQVWGIRTVSEATLARTMTRLRRMLRDHGLPRGAILTEHRRGFRFTRSVIASLSDVRARTADPWTQTISSFVGRDRVLLQLIAALADAQHGRPALIVLRGEPGIGKTRVAEMVAARSAHVGFATAWVHCGTACSTLTLGPFIELLRSVIGWIEATTGSQLSTHPWWPELASLMAERTGAPESAEREQKPCVASRDAGLKTQLFDSVTQALAFAAEITPCVLVIEELQQADEASLELLHHLLTHLAPCRLLLMATLSSVRTNNVAASARLSSALRHRSCVRVALAPLTKLETARYVASRVGAAGQELCSRIHQLSDGNPYCMTALVQQFLNGDILDASNIAVPVHALALAESRLAQLSTDACEVLRYASAIGTVFSLPLLAAVVGRSASSLLVMLEAACAAEVVQPVAESRTEFRFVQLVRAALYHGQSAAERRMRHVHVARALEQRLATAEVPYSDLADHAYAALPDYDLCKTVRCCVRAANTAGKLCARADAIRYLEYAREALDILESRRPSTRLQLLFRHALVRSQSSVGVSH